jgi:Domain of unknown function (DUF4157)
MNRHRDYRLRDRDRLQTDRIAHAHSGSPQPVPLQTRALLEPLFGHNFQDVRVYSDDHAGRGAQSLHAKAFTVGQDIAFAPGRYEPNTPQGQRLLAHELAHTVQQRGASTFPNTSTHSLEVSRPSDAHERNANAMVSSLGHGRAAMPAAHSSGLAIQCEDASEPEIGYSLDPSDPNAHVNMPVGDGTASAVVDTSGAGLNLQMPDLSAQAGYDWQNGPYAQGQYQLDPARSIGAQADSGGASAYIQTPEFQLNGGVTDGYQTPYVNGQGQVGPVSGNFNYTPETGLDANAQVYWPDGSLKVGTSGASLEQRFGAVDTSLSTDYERLEAQARLNAAIAGQPVNLTGQAGMGLDGTKPNVGIQATAPNLLGLPISPTVGVNVTENGIDPNAGLGIQRQF